MKPHRTARLLALSLCLAASCAGSSALRTDPLERSWAAEPESRLRPPATILFEEGGERRLILCVAGGVYVCPESGAGRVESVWSGARPVAAIAPAGANQGLLLVEAAGPHGTTDRVLLTDLAGESRVLYEAEGRLLGVPMRVGTREAWLTSTSRGGDENALLVTADMQGRRAVKLQSADLDAVYHIARHPHTGRTLVSGVRRIGSRTESGLFELTGRDLPRARLIDASAWSPAWSGCGKHLAVAVGERSAEAARVRYGPLDDCVLRVTGPASAVHEIPIDGVVLALCFDPADEDLLFAAVADQAEVRADDLGSIRILRVRVARDGLQSSQIASLDLSRPGEPGPEIYLTSN